MKAELHKSMIENLIDQWILNDRNRKIAKRRMIDGIYYESLAEEFDLSVRQIKNIVYKCEDIVYNKAVQD